MHAPTAVVQDRLVAPVAYQVILEPGIGQFREFEFPRVHTLIDSYVRRDFLLRTI